MAGQVSTMHAVRKALVAALVAASAAEGSALAGVRIKYGPPLPNAPAEFVWVGSARGEENARSLGNRKRHEEYTIAVHVSVLRPGRDSEAAGDRAHDMIGAVAETVRDAPTLAGTYDGPGHLVHVQFAGVREDDTRANDTAREHYAACDVAVLARI